MVSSKIGKVFRFLRKNHALSVPMILKALKKKKVVISEYKYYSWENGRLYPDIREASELLSLYGVKVVLQMKDI